MSRKSKIDPVEKIRAVERVLSGERSISEEARLLGVDRKSIADWKRIYLCHATN